MCRKSWAQWARWTWMAFGAVATPIWANETNGERLIELDQSFRSTKFAADGPREYSSDGSAALIDRQIVEVSNTRWIQLVFGDCELGSDSYLVLRSQLDGATQRLDTTTLEQWRHRSAYFNGGQVEVSLWQSAADEIVSYSLRAASAEPPIDGNASAEKTICGNTDDRVPSNDPATGRLRVGTSVACTTFIVSNGALLTAGHCQPAFQTVGAVVEFNAPASGCDGSVAFASPDDQYSVNWISARLVVDQNGTRPGEDYAVVAVFPNSNTGLLPAQRQGAFYRLWPYVEYAYPSSVRVTGYGTDSDPVGCTGSTNSGHNAQQTHSGSFLGRFAHAGSTYSVRYRADTQSGCSGAPIIQATGSLWSVPVAIGIHYDGGCNSASDSFNIGTAALTDGLRVRLQRFYVDQNNLPQSLTMVYVDAAMQGGLLEDGRFYDPFQTVQAALQGAPDDALVSIVPGNYSAPLTIDRPLTLLAPVGAVTLGGTP